MLFFYQSLIVEQSIKVNNIDGENSGLFLLCRLRQSTVQEKDILFLINFLLFLDFLYTFFIIISSNKINLLKTYIIFFIEKRENIKGSNAEKYEMSSLIV